LFCEAHLVGLADQRHDPLVCLVAVNGQFDGETLADSRLGSGKDGTLLPEVCYGSNLRIPKLEFPLGRNLRHLRQQSKSDPGGKVGEWCWGGTLAAWHVGTFVTHE
jgi:hypothetical protein